MTKILVIEDNKANMELMCYLFQYYGYDVITAVDGEEGVSKVKEEKPDLIICDILLPKLDGYQIAKILKKDAELKKIPLIAVTAFAMLGDRDKIRAAGFDAYIAKPINPSQFIIQIESLLSPELRLKHEVEIQPDDDIFIQEAANTKMGTAIVVADYAGTVELFKSLLVSMGFEVVTSHNVKLAMESIQQKAPNIILSDFHMAEVNGIQFLEMIRSNDLWKSIPFVIFSATHPSSDELEKFKTLNLNRFMSLPIDANAFIKIIDDIYAEHARQVRLGVSKKISM